MESSRYNENDDKYYNLYMKLSHEKNEYIQCVNKLKLELKECQEQNTLLDVQNSYLKKKLSESFDSKPQLHEEGCELQSPRHAENDEIYNKWFFDTKELKEKINVLRLELAGCQERNFVLDEQNSYLKKKLSDLVDSKLQLDKEGLELENTVFDLKQQLEDLKAKFDESSNNPFCKPLNIKASELSACKCLECGEILIRWTKYIVKHCDC
jgi:regulator of replication initiation timing